MATTPQAELERPQCAAPADSPHVLPFLCGHRKDSVELELDRGHRKDSVERGLDRCAHHHVRHVPGSYRRLQMPVLAYLVAWLIAHIKTGSTHKQFDIGQVTCLLDVILLAVEEKTGVLIFDDAARLLLTTLQPSAG